MDMERKVYEDHPLNSTGATKIYLNTGKSRKVNSPNDGTVIHLNTDKQADLGLHLNTTFSIASSKKVKLLFVLNFLLSLVCMVICFGVACYYWHELSALRRQVDVMKDHLLIQNLHQEKLVKSVGRQARPIDEREVREPRTFIPVDNTAQPDHTKKFFVEDLGQDLLFVDLKKKSATNAKDTTTNIATMQKDLAIIHFDGAYPELNMGSKSLIGPWKQDNNVSKNNNAIEMSNTFDHVVVKEGGLYLVYAQITYLTQAPSSYYVWAHQTGDVPRLLSVCATGDDSSKRSLDKSHITCAVHTVARLHAGDVVNLSQGDKDRTLLLKQGYSYFGFVKLGQ